MVIIELDVSDTAEVPVIKTSTIASVYPVIFCALDIFIYSYATNAFRAR